MRKHATSVMLHLRVKPRCVDSCRDWIDDLYEHLVNKKLSYDTVLFGVNMYKRGTRRRASPYVRVRLQTGATGSGILLHPV
jgi:hypothetical protein